MCRALRKMLQEDEGDRQHKDVQLEKLVYLFLLVLKGIFVLFPLRTIFYG
jgi:hypothetical protein